MIKGTHIEATETELILTFVANEEFKALRMAEEWCKRSGYSIGSLQADAPTGLLRGDVAISKWRNMTQKQREALDGTISAPGRTYRTGPVYVRINRGKACRSAVESQ